MRRRRPPRRNDCDFVALKRDHLAWTGIAHVAKVSIKTALLPKPLTFPKSSIAYIHFKQLPYQTADYIQLTSGGSATGEIVNLPKVDFTLSENGETVELQREALLALMFRCSIDAAVAASRGRRKGRR